MYLVPITYDYFFKKVFSHPNIAKQFLEDMLSVTIESFEVVEIAHKLTNKAMEVKFDFRCKIDGKYSVIEMQRYYPKDSVKRFYTYSCTGNVVQLEQILSKRKEEENRILTDTGKLKRIKDEYKYILPTKTIVWLVHETLGFKSDFINFTILPQNYLDFIQDTKFWESADLEEIQKKRNLLLELSRNDTKGLSFLPQNQLIFVFQRNIVKNKSHQKYASWFEFAQKSMDKGNQKRDFEVYERDNTFEQIIKLLKTKDMNLSEINIAEIIQKDVEIEVEGRIEEAVQEAVQEAIQEKEEIIQRKEEIIQQILKEKEQIAQQEKMEAIAKMRKLNLPIEVIADLLKLTVETTQQYIKAVEKSEEL